MLETEMKVGLSGPDLPVLVRAMVSRLLPKTSPSALSVDFTDQAPGADWLETRMLKARRRAKAVWAGDSWNFLLVESPVALIAGPHARDARQVLAELAPLPFFLASFASLYSDWKVDGKAYAAPILDDLHYPHGWGCAFRGQGHARLVSRRWLEFGPWRLLKGPDDVSLVQFHDLEADPATALEQAKPGHARMGANAEGGVIRSGYARKHRLDGFYEPKDQLLRMVIHGRDVSASEMLDACSLRLDGAVGPGQPLTRVAYVFMEPERARAHLHELWLRELECWTLEMGKEVRLDKDYRPTPVKPDWVKAVEAREAGVSKR
ncbi:hypothetical protein [Myxococcus qinghaiensis]|uniref:hypothetical protein n=1 Tax=Myxococcus qinghaiensis TaxID=2906758 RepID=UPI0020A751A1|nr:hypothetical protein [Myxococcus qinghaiensis]MCP3166822.1 hypothetical protein [Myxococcus qinghaiensis]